MWREQGKAPAPAGDHRARFTETRRRKPPYTFFFRIG
jgi:hypothetical protein